MSEVLNESGFCNISTKELQALLRQGELCLVDVRTAVELANGKIPQGISSPLHLLPTCLQEMDKNATTVFYCQMGVRSWKAAAFAAANGFTNVHNLSGGIAAWKQAGLPLSL